MAKHLVFLDIDGTLIDANYIPNDSSLPQLIESIEKNNDVVFALNSNRSLEDILPFAEQFKIKGAIVCENGLFVYFPDTGKSLNLANEDHLNTLEELKENVFQWSKESSELFNSDVLWLEGEVDQNDLSSKEGLVIIKPVTSRKYTVSLHIQKVVNNKIVPYREGVELLAKKYKQRIEVLGLQDDVVVRVSDSHPSILIYSNKYTKHDGAVHLRNEVYPNSTVIAIGNDPDDFEMVKDSGEFWAVKNAKPGALILASKIAYGEYTKGVIELLQSYFTNTNGT